MVTNEIRRVRGAKRTHVCYENRDVVVDALLKLPFEQNAFQLSVSTSCLQFCAVFKFLEGCASVRHHLRYRRTAIRHTVQNTLNAYVKYGSPAPSLRKKIRLGAGASHSRNSFVESFDIADRVKTFDEGGDFVAIANRIVLARL